ncbi:MAG TPA: hybrid sensor histidine kinase/response regulator [Planctomycetota bacterium]|jgi:signal transduction histidine kinase|nr:hybrid sensor histidine kinase/response regulator [Planctomycetota bacterium]
MKFLRVLIVEDSEDDAQLMLHELRRGGYAPKHRRVETEDGMREAVSSGPWDVVLADYSLPQFSGANALALLRKTGLDLPFIIVSGAIGEATAVAAMKAGAHDYVMKNNLSRLVPAVERELRDAVVRRERRDGEEELRAHAAEIEVLNHRLDDERAELATFHDLVTHDVSNFSMALLGIIERLLGKTDGPLTERQEALLQRANRQGLTVSRLAENAKLFARLRRQGLQAERQPMLLGGAIRRAVETVEAMHFDKEFRIQVDCAEDLSVPAVPFLENAFLNLLDNAVRHAAKEKEKNPVIRVRAYEHSGQVHVTFRNGARLEDEVRRHLFERYTKGPRSTGSGLGLALVREIVEGLGGRIWAANLGGGETEHLEIVISLPRT